MHDAQLACDTSAARTTDRHDQRATALQIYDLLRLLDPISVRHEQLGNIRALARSIKRAAQGFLDAPVTSNESLKIDPPPFCFSKQELTEIIALFSSKAAAELQNTDCCARLSQAGLREHLRPFRQRLHKLYGRIVTAESTIGGKLQYLPEHRPSNYARSLFHSGGALLIALLIAITPSASLVSLLLGLAVAIGWIFDLSRLHSKRFNQRFFALMGRLAHPHEQVRINSSVWLLTGTFAVSLLGSPSLTIMAVLVLGFADPVAGFVGRRFGRIPLVHGRTLEGSAAFLLVATLIAAATGFYALPTLGLVLLWPFALVSAGAGTLAELFSRRLDDNFLIPLFTGVAGYFFLVNFA